MKMSAEELAQAISSFVNGANYTQMEKLAKLMANDHPTLQQSKMRLVCIFIEQMVNNQHTDARNEDTKRVANSMIKGFKVHVREEYVKKGGFISESLDDFIDNEVIPSRSLPIV